MERSLLPTASDDTQGVNGLVAWLRSPCSDPSRDYDWVVCPCSVQSRDQDDSTWWAKQPGESGGGEWEFYVKVGLKMI